MKQLLHSALVDEQSRPYLILSYIIGVLIVLSVIAIIFESVDAIERSYHTFFIAIEIFFTLVFTLEYAGRIYTANNKHKYALSFFGIVDLLSFLPSYLIFLFGVSLSAHFLAVLRVLRIMRLLRLFRVLKIAAAAVERNRLNTQADQVPWLNILIYVTTLLSVIVIAGTLIYLAEQGVPHTSFTNIPQGMWWAVVTITTVGYGDLTPVTVLGKIIAATTMLSGLVFLVLMISVLGRPLQSVIFGTPLEATDTPEQKSSSSMGFVYPMQKDLHTSRGLPIASNHLDQVQHSNPMQPTVENYRAVR